MQFPESTQGFNRYAYVGNNPLSYNDPSGYFVVEVMAAGAAIASWAASSWYAAMIVGATVGYVTTGSLEGALFGAVSGLTAYGVGVLPGFNDPFTDTLWRAAMHGFVQGGIASAQHGSFRSGFLSAFTSKLLGPKEGSWNDFTGEMGGRVIQSAVIGGTASVIGGGKFANEAVTAAFVQLFNEEASRQRASNFQKNLAMAGNISIDDGGNVTIAASVSAEAGQEGARDVFISRASGTQTVKSGCNIFGRGCATQYALSIDLSKHTGSGIGDIHVVSRAGMASLNASYAVSLSSPGFCTSACATLGDRYIHINDLTLSSGQLRHELFHVIGFSHGTRPAGDFMHSRGGRMMPSHIEEIHRHYGR